MKSKRKYCKSILSLVLVIMIFLSIATISGCSSKSTIVGTWLYNYNGEVKSYNTMYFYDDGTCLDTPVKSISSGRAKSYKVQDDGMLIFSMSWDGTTETFKQTDDKEIALKSKGYYYLSGNTFILCGNTYTRE